MKSQLDMVKDFSRLLATVKYSHTSIYMLLDAVL